MAGCLRPRDFTAFPTALDLITENEMTEDEELELLLNSYRLLLGEPSLSYAGLCKVQQQIEEHAKQLVMQLIEDIINLKKS